MPPTKVCNASKHHRRRASHDGEVQKAIRLKLAIEAYENAMGTMSYRRIAREFGVCRSTMQARMAGQKSLEQMHQNQQLLTPEEELSVVHSIERMHSWGWPYRVSQVLVLAKELLMKRMLLPPVIGGGLVSRFLQRHLSLKSRFSIPKDKDRVLAEDPVTIQSWFKLYNHQITKFKVKERDTYNMDEKGYAIGMIGKARVILSTYERVAYMMQDGSREWVTTLDCACLDGSFLDPMIIFKGKLCMKEWLKHLRNKFTNVDVSETGWTDNQLGFAWFRDNFELQSRERMQGDDCYRLLFLDGHSSHITRQVINFCEDNKIILLCLPAHSTHILQPLDVGVFGPLAARYKQLLGGKSRPGAGYHIDRIDFLNLYQDAREQILRSSIILSAFEKSGYKLWNPQKVIDDLPCAKLKPHIERQAAIQDISPPSVDFGSSLPERLLVPVNRLQNSLYSQMYCPKTPVNILQVDSIIQQAQILDGKIDPIAFKLAQVLKTKLVDCEVKASENVNIMAAFREKKKRSRARVNATEGQLLNRAYLEELEAKDAKAQFQKNELKKVKFFQAECRSLWKLTSLFTQGKKERKKPSRRSAVNIITPPQTPSRLSLILEPESARSPCIITSSTPKKQQSPIHRRTKNVRFDFSLNFVSPPTSPLSPVEDLTSLAQIRIS